MRGVVAAVDPIEQLLVGDQGHASGLRGGDDRLVRRLRSGVVVVDVDPEGAVVAERADRVVEKRVTVAG